MKRKRIAEQIDHLHLFGHLRVGVARRPEPLASFGAAGSIGRIQDQLDRQARHIRRPERVTLRVTGSEVFERKPSHTGASPVVG